MSDDKEMKEKRRYARWVCDRMAWGAARLPESLKLAPLVPNPPEEELPRLRCLSS